MSLLCGLLCCCLQFTKLHFVVQSAGGEAILCNYDSAPSDGDLLSDSACIVWYDVSPESNPGRHVWVHHIQQLMTRFARSVNFSSIYME